MSWLNTVWFVLFVAIVAGYLIMDGFDLGVGILHLLVGRSDAERRVLLNSIGPVWDGNAVWLVVTGGALFAVFPIVYAALFSGFYGAMMLVLLTLILRPVAIEFRSKLEGPRWRALWDGVFAGASLGLALLLGVAFGNIVAGVPLSAEGQVEIEQPAGPAAPLRPAHRGHHGGHAGGARRAVPQPQDRGGAAGPGAGLAAPPDGGVRPPGPGHRRPPSTSPPTRCWPCTGRCGRWSSPWAPWPPSWGPGA